MLIELVSNLDVSVPPDIGFMVPFDRVSTTRIGFVHGFKFDLLIRHLIFISSLSLLIVAHFLYPVPRQVQGRNVRMAGFYGIGSRPSILGRRH
jgi:hypothetical protein